MAGLVKVKVLKPVNQVISYMEFQVEYYISACINDIRLNAEWFPMQNSENEQSDAATLEYERNVFMDCIRDDCANVDCPKGVPMPMVCVPLWGSHECRYVTGHCIHFTF